MKKIIITPENSNQRIDKFLVKEFFSYTRGEINRLIKDGKVKLNNQSPKLSYNLKESDLLTILFPKNKKIYKLVANENIKIEVIYQDKNIIVVNKPAGISVHPVRITDENALVNGLISFFPEIKKIGDGSNNSELRPGLVHRLDKDTSGVMVVARSQKVFEELKKLFQERKVSKEYLVLVQGKLEHKSGKIDQSVARSKNYKKQIVANSKTKTKIREAVTEYEVLKEYNNFSLVLARPKTGRMHQVRIHMFSIGHPVAGDRMYQKKIFYELKRPSRQMLHAQKIDFCLGKKAYSFFAPRPKDFSQFIKSLD